MITTMTIMLDYNGWLKVIRISQAVHDKGIVLQAFLTGKLSTELKFRPSGRRTRQGTPIWRVV